MAEFVIGCFVFGVLLGRWLNDVSMPHPEPVPLIGNAQTPSTAELNAGDER